MCGIAGAVGPGATRAAVERAIDALHHRGPDASGVWEAPSGGAIVGAVRLRIVDTSQAGDQPMTSVDGNIVVAFNGELYNFRDLRAGLERRGHRFRTATDTECLVHLYEESAGAVDVLLNQLRGMFAFSIWDERRQRLLLARDRLGIKPLHFVERHGVFGFASEARALVAGGLASGDPDVSAVRAAIPWGFFPGGHSIFDGVREVPPGHHLVRDRGRSTLRQWWQPQIEPDVALSDPNEARSEMASALDDAVARQLIADRPVGCFLSSGTDSVAVATTAARHGLMTALTVTFPEQDETDEGEAAAAVAKSLGIEHSVVPVTGKDAAIALRTALGDLDRPTGDAFNTWLVSRAAHDGGLVVALAGTGGDELFGGYHTFEAVPRLALMHSLIKVVPKSARRSLVARSKFGSRIGRSVDGSGGYSGSYAAVRSLFSGAETLRLGGLPASAAEVSGLAARDAVTILELTHYLPHQLLADTDSASMAHSLEVRVPLLDDAVVATALATPWKVRTAHGKRLLRQAAGIELTVPKRTFTLPFDRWMREELRAPVEEGLLSEALPFAELIPLSGRQEIWKGFERGDVHWSRPWWIAMLRLWPGANGLSWK